MHIICDASLDGTETVWITLLRRTLACSPYSDMGMRSVELCINKILQLTMEVPLMQVDLYTHTHPFNGPLSGTTWVSRYQKSKINVDFTGARDSEWQWHQLNHMQVCTALQTDSHASTAPLSFLWAVCPSCRPINSVKALKGQVDLYNSRKMCGCFVCF